MQRQVYQSSVIRKRDHVANNGFTCATNSVATDSSSFSSAVVSASASACHGNFQQYHSHEIFQAFMMVTQKEMTDWKGVGLPRLPQEIQEPSPGVSCSWRSSSRTPQAHVPEPQVILRIRHCSKLHSTFIVLHKTSIPNTSVQFPQFKRSF